MEWLKNWLSDAGENLDALIDKLKLLAVPGLLPATLAVEMFQTTLQEWFEKYNQIYQIPTGSLPINLEMNRKKLLVEGGKIEDKLKSAGVTGDFISGQLGVFFIPFIAIGVITAIGALILNWTFNYLEFTKKLDLFNRLLDEGKTPSQAAKIIGDMFPEEEGFFGDINKTLMWTAIIGGGWLLFQFIYKMDKAK